MNTLPFGEPDKRWTLFLDRDGVINERPPGDYVKKFSDFHFMPGVTQAIAHLSSVFGRIIIVTNQQGIGKGLMSTEDLGSIHLSMADQIRKAGGQIDAVYHCPHKAEEGCDCRKPANGMFLQALEQFPAIRPEQSIMVGDTASDVGFARNCGMYAVVVGESFPDEYHADYYSVDLSSFAMALLNSLKKTT
ncbi:MAG: HAD family hydrolase [Bacteroidales bacterium]|nr:HAD family hydrolase [Bacteroidales bacterium]